LLVIAVLLLLVLEQHQGDRRNQDPDQFWLGLHGVVVFEVLLVVLVVVVVVLAVAVVIVVGGGVAVTVIDVVVVCPKAFWNIARLNYAAP